jgi:hypothetical protein
MPTGLRRSLQRHHGPKLGMMFDTEFEAFKAYDEEYPAPSCCSSTLFGALLSGLPNAIRTAHEVLEPWASGCGATASIRGLSLSVRENPGAAGAEGLTDCRIVRVKSPDDSSLRNPLPERAHRLLRRGRAADHLPVRAGFRRRLQAVRRTPGRRDLGTEIKARGKRGQDHHAGL